MSDTLPSTSGPTPSLTDYENAVSDVYSQDGSSSYIPTNGLIQVDGLNGNELVSPSDELSDGLFASVYENLAGNLIVAFEGTWPLPPLYFLGVIDADAKLASQLTSPGIPGPKPLALTKAVDFVTNDVLPYARDANIPFSDIFVTGHSLGASEAENVIEEVSGLGGGDGFAGTGVPRYVGSASASATFVNYLNYGDPVANDASDSPSGQAFGIADQNHVGTIVWLGNQADQQLFIDDHTTIADLTNQAAADGGAQLIADEVALAGADAKETIDLLAAVKFHLFGNYTDQLDKSAAAGAGSWSSDIAEIYPQLQNITTTTDSGGNKTQQGSYSTQTSGGAATTTVAETTFSDGAYEFDTTITLGAAFASDDVDYDQLGKLISNNLSVNGRMVSLQVGENASIAVSPKGQIVARVDSASGTGLLNIVADPSGSSASAVSVTDSGSQLIAVVSNNGSAETTLNYNESTQQATVHIDGGIIDPVVGSIPYLEENSDGSFVTELPDSLSGSAALIEQKPDGSVDIVDAGAGGTDGESLMEFAASYFLGDEIDLSDLNSATMVTAEIGVGDTFEVIGDQETSGITDDVDFKGNSGILKLDDAGSFAGTIFDLGPGDIIDLVGVGTADGAELGAGNVLSLKGVAGITLTLDPDQDYSGESFLLKSDGKGGTDIVAEADSGTMAFTGADETLVVVDPQQFIGAVSNLVSGDDIDLSGNGTITDYNGTVTVNAKLLPTMHIDGGAGSSTLDLSQIDQDINIVGTSKDSSERTVIGSSSDTLASDGFSTFILGSGNAFISDNNVNQTFDLGSGTSGVLSLGWGSVVHAGTGEDTFNVSDDTLVVGAKATDHIAVFGTYDLTGGLNWAGSESPWAVGADGTEYGIDTKGELLIKDILGDVMSVANYVGGPDVPYAKDTAGIYVASVSVSAYLLLDNPAGSNWQATQFAFANALAKAYLGTSFYQGVDPLVLDLGGNGLNLTDTSSAAPLFDMHANGFEERTGWIEPGDGFLVLDKNGNGKIDNASEMFGNSTTGGFASLAAYDANGDGVINADDPIFSRLEIWRDLNGNGVTDADELETLAQAGITSIDLKATMPASTDIVGGNQLLSQSTFTYADGTTGAIADVSFHTDDFNTVYTGDTSVIAAAAALPDVKGFGTLSDLHVAMSHDPALTGAVAGQTLIDVVQSTLPTLTSVDLPTLRNEITPILTAWAKAVELPDASGDLAPVTPTGHADMPLLVVTNDDGTTVTDFAYQVTDSLGSYWKRASGLGVTDASKVVIARPTLAQVLAETPADGQWTVMSGAQIDFFERYTGDTLPLGSVPANPTAALAALGPVVNQLYTVLNQITVALAMAGPLAPYFAGIAYDATDLRQGKPWRGGRM